MSAAVVRNMFRSHPDNPSHAEVISRCIDACFACVETCTACADACLAEKNVEKLISCISPQPRLRGGLHGDGQHHVARQQGRPSPVAGSAIDDLHRLLPGLRRRMRTTRRNAQALRGLRQGLQTTASRPATRCCHRCACRRDPAFSAQERAARAAAILSKVGRRQRAQICWSRPQQVCRSRLGIEAYLEMARRIGEIAADDRQP